MAAPQERPAGSQDPPGRGTEHRAPSGPLLQSGKRHDSSERPAHHGVAVGPWTRWRGPAGTERGHTPVGRLLRWGSPAAQEGRGWGQAGFGSLPQEGVSKPLPSERRVMNNVSSPTAAFCGQQGDAWRFHGNMGHSSPTSAPPRLLQTRPRCSCRVGR